MFVVGGVRIDGVCCWRCKVRWCLLLEVLGWMMFVVGVCKDGWRLLFEL